MDKLWLKTKLQTASKLPWATRGDLDDWITLNYPKPLCRCESRCAKTNDYYFQLIHMTDSSWSANLRPAGSTCTEHSGHLIWWRRHTFPTCMLQPPAGCSVSCDGNPLIERELWMFMCQNVNGWQSQQARPRLEEGVKWLIFHLQVNEAFWWMFSVKRASVTP